MREEVNASSLSPLALLEEALLLMLPPDHVSRIEWREPTHHSIENHFSRYRDLISRLVAGRFEHCVFEDLKLSKVCSTEVLKDLSADFCEQSPRKVSSRLIEWNDLPPVWNSINSWISERRERILRDQDISSRFELLLAGVAAFLAFLRDNVSGPHWQSTSFADRAHDRMQSDNWLDTEDARVPEETLFRLGSEGYGKNLSDDAREWAAAQCAFRETAYWTQELTISNSSDLFDSDCVDPEADVYRTSLESAPPCHICSFAQLSSNFTERDVVRQSLSRNGELFSEFIRFPEAFLFSVACFEDALALDGLESKDSSENLVNSDLKSFKYVVGGLYMSLLPSFSWWLTRIARCWQECLPHPAADLRDLILRHSLAVSQSTILFSFNPAHVDDSLHGEVLNRLPSFYRESLESFCSTSSCARVLHPMALLEVSLSLRLYDDPRSESFVRSAAAQSDFHFQLTGGHARKRTDQIRDTAVLVVLGRSSLPSLHFDKIICSDPMRISYARIGDDTSSESSAPVDIIEGESATYGSKYGSGAREVPFADDPSNVFLDSVEVDLHARESYKALHASEDVEDGHISMFDCAMLLSLCHEIRTRNPADDITREEMLPFVTRALSESRGKSYGIHTCALAERARIERHSHRTADRAVLQLQALVDQFRDKEPVVWWRLRDMHFCERGYVPRIVLMREVGDCMYRLGAFRSALEIFHKTKDLDGVVRCLSAIGESRSAEELIRKQISRLEDSIQSSNNIQHVVSKKQTMNLSDLYCWLGDVTSDDTFYSIAWNISQGRCARAYRTLGVRCARSGQFEEAASYLHQALEVNPIYPDCWFTRGCSLMQLERMEEARTCFIRCVSLQPENGQAWNNLAACCQQLRRLQDAFRAYAEAVRHLENQWMIWENYLYVAMQIGEFGVVTLAFKRLIQLKPKEPDLRILRMLVDICCGQSSVSAVREQLRKSNSLRFDCSDVDSFDNLHDDVLNDGEDDFVLPEGGLFSDIDVSNPDVDMDRFVDEYLKDMVLHSSVPEPSSSEVDLCQGSGENGVVFASEFYSLRSEKSQKDRIQGFLSGSSSQSDNPENWEKSRFMRSIQELFDDLRQQVSSVPEIWELQSRMYMSQGRILESIDALVRAIRLLTTGNNSQWDRNRESILLVLRSSLHYLDTTLSAFSTLLSKSDRLETCDSVADMKRFLVQGKLTCSNIAKRASGSLFMNDPSNVDTEIKEKLDELTERLSMVEKELKQLA